MLKKWFTFFLIVHSVLLYAGWNEVFDKDSALLAEELPALQNPDYQAQYKTFTKIRKKLLNDQDLVQKIQNWKIDVKLMVIKNDLGVIVKKRRNNHFHDLHPWELSYVTNCNQYMVPSFPMEIGGKIVIVQQLEKFTEGSLNDGHSRALTKKVSLETYWKALLQAYIMGVSDLVAPNIGISPNGTIRFFDTEACFIYRNIPFKIHESFKMGFQCQAIDWPQFKEPLDRKTAQSIQNFVSSFIDDYENNLQIYLSYRPFNFSEPGLHLRVEMLKNFIFEKGVTFEDFHTTLYPKMSPGLNELSSIVSDILKIKAGKGVSLFFVCRRMKKTVLTAEQKAAVQEWINIYID